MKNSFYKYVKNEIKKIPNSAFFDVSALDISEDDFIDYIRKMYSVDLINFDKKTLSGKQNFDGSIIVEIEDTMTYHCKLNNQLYLEYVFVNKDIKNDFPYLLRSISVYSSTTNEKELISFIEYISEYIKNK